MNLKLRVFSTVLLSGLALAGCDISPGIFGSSDGSSSDSDEEYTILLRAFAGPGHMQEAQRFKENTERQANWQNLYIITKVNSSELYWGKYRTLDAAKPNVIRAHAYTTPVGIKPYPQAIVLKMPGKDIGPAEYNLANANGAYTVLIAAFFDVPSANYCGRKNFAVEYCKQLRDAGEEAYFYHDLTQSIVTIGLFSESAIGKRKANAGTVTETYASDPRIDTILARHPYLAENGRKVRVHVPTIEKKAQWVDKRSYVIAKPKKEENDLDSFSNPQSR